MTIQATKEEIDVQTQLIELEEYENELYQVKVHTMSPQEFEREFNRVWEEGERLRNLQQEFYDKRRGNLSNHK